MAFELDECIGTAVKMLQNMNQLSVDKQIPISLLRNCQGVAFLRIYKAGLFLLSGNISGGCVIAKIDDPTHPQGFRWSPPASIECFGLGGGFVFGGEVIDSIIVLNHKSAIQSFFGSGQITLGGNVSLAVGPVGKDIEVHVGVADNLSMIAAYSYSQAKGVYVGGTLEGSVLFVNDRKNTMYYQDRRATAENLLSGKHTPPLGNPELSEMLQQVLYNSRGMVITASSLPVMPTQSSSSSSSHNSSASKSGRALFQQAMESVLPPGWQETLSSDGNKYYYNTDTYETSWTRPT